MSRTRDLRSLPNSNSRNPTSNEHSNHQNSFRAPVSGSSTSDFRDYDQSSILPGSAPPMRPQRSAARQQPGLAINNVSLSPPNSNNRNYPSPLGYDDNRYQDIRVGPDHSHPQQATYITPPRSNPSGGNRKLYQAVTRGADPSSGSSSSSRHPNRNGYLDQDYQARDDSQYGLSSRNIPKDHHPRRLSTASSTVSVDHEGNQDLLSPSDLKDAKKMHGVRNVLEAFSTQAEKKPNQKARVNQQNSAMARSGSRPITSLFNDQSYPRTPGFGEIERVLEKIKLSWDSTGIAGTSSENDMFNQSDTPSPPFSAVGLALELLESENPDVANSAKRAKDMINKKGGLTPSLSAFLQLKAELEKALQLTVQGNYRQFDASVNSYKLVKASVDASYKKVSELKAKLMECRVTLGNGSPSLALNTAVVRKGAEMKMLQARREILGEMLKLIDTIDRLKQVPERLESLISSKSFLSATVLLVRSLKVINKPEFAEIGGLSDLRTYLANQESVVFEILIEELHNHLYLKNYFSHNKWRAYRPGQVTLPVIHSPDESASEPFGPFAGSNSTGHDRLSWQIETSSNRKSNRNSNGPSTSIPWLQSYLSDLMTQPQSNPLVEEADLFLGLASSTTHPESNNQNSRRISISHARKSTWKRRNPVANPELDSFKYIESLIESFAVLGKLTLGLDTVLQRVPVEIYALVESTSNEVDERHENTQRFFSSSTTNKNSLKSSLKMIILLITTSRAPLPENPPLRSAVGRASQQFPSFKINNNDLRELEAVTYILQDFFWTLYSKLDATLQCFRVLHEVSLRISERKYFKEEGMKSNLVLFSLLEVWKPIQSELLALIHAYLTEPSEDQFSGTDGMQAKTSNKTSTSVSRNPMASIAEVLKINISGNSSSHTVHMSWKETNKQLFKFKDAGVKQNYKDFQAHEASLYSALKASVPGLVLDSKALNPAMLTTGIMIDDSSGARGNSTHRLLAQPDPFHIAHLLKPTFEFLKRAKEVLPSGVVMISNDHSSHSSTSVQNADEAGLPSSLQEDWDENAHMDLAKFVGFSGFLDEFVLHTFLPQLEDKVIHVFEHSVNASDAFQDGAANQLITNFHGINLTPLQEKRIPHAPVAKSVAAVMSLIECLGNLLCSTSFHQDKFGRLMISIVVQYYQKCHERFKEMVVRESFESTAIVDESNPHVNLKLAADWAQKPDVLKHLQNLKKLPTDTTNLRKSLKRLCQVEARYLSSRSPLVTADLIQSPKKIAALAHLYSTLLSFMSSLRRLGSSVKPIPSSREEVGPEFGTLDTNWMREFGSFAKTERQKSIPLTYALMRRFQLVYGSFSTLAQTILSTIHLELRLETYYYIDQAFVVGNYFLSRSDSIEPDPKIIELNSLISNYSENLIIKNLSRKDDRKFVFIGLVNLINDLMILNVRKLNTANEIGFKKMSKNSIALQQNLKSVLLNNHLYHSGSSSNEKLGCSEQTSRDIQSDHYHHSHTFDSNFERCRTFWEMASNGPQAVMESVRGGDGYSFEEYRKLLELLCLNDRNPTLIQVAASSSLSGGHLGAQDEPLSSPTSHFSNAFSNLNKGSATEKRKRLYNECLIELHALVLEDEEEDGDDDQAEENHEEHRHNVDNETAHHPDSDLVHVTADGDEDDQQLDSNK